MYMLRTEQYRVFDFGSSALRTISVSKKASSIVVCGAEWELLDPSSMGIELMTSKEQKKPV